MIPKASDFSPLDHYQLMKTCIEAGNCSSLSDRNLTKEELVSSLREAITTGPGIPNVNKRLVEMKIRKFIQLPGTLLTFTTPSASISTSATFFSEPPQPSCSYANPLEVLIEAINTNNLELAKEAIARDKNIVQHMTKEGYTILTFAVRQRCVNIAMLLIDAGADVNALNPFSPYRSSSAIWHACQQRDWEMAFILLEKGASLRIIYDCQTPLGFASLYRPTMNRFLANVPEKDKDWDQEFHERKLLSHMFSLDGEFQIEDSKFSSKHQRNGYRKAIQADNEHFLLRLGELRNRSGSAWDELSSESRESLNAITASDMAKLHEELAEINTTLNSDPVLTTNQGKALTPDAEAILNRGDTLVIYMRTKHTDSITHSLHLWGITVTKISGSEEYSIDLCNCGLYAEPVSGVALGRFDNTAMLDIVHRYSSYDCLEDKSGIGDHLLKELRDRIASQGGDSIRKKPQKVGNCAYKSERAIRSSRRYHILLKYMGSSEAKRLEKEISRIDTIETRGSLLQQYLARHIARKQPTQPDWDMLGQIYVYLRLNSKQANLLESLLQFVRLEKEDTDPTTFLLDAGGLNEQLFAAIATNDIEFLQKFTASGMDLNKFKRSGRTALEEAIYSRKFEIAKLLLEALMNPNTQTPLDWKMLGRIYIDWFANGIQVNLQDLLLRIAQIHGRNTDSTSPIDNSSASSFLLDAGGVKKQLFAAVQANNIELLQWVIDSGIDLNKVKRSGQTALEEAIYSSKFKAAKLLLEALMNPKTPTQPNWNILGRLYYFLFSKDNLSNSTYPSPFSTDNQNLQELLLRCVQVHSLSADSASSMDAPSARCFLLEAGNIGESLFRTIQDGNINPLEKIIASGMDLNKVKIYNNTILFHLLCFLEESQLQFEAVKLLLATQTNPSAPNPLDWNRLSHIYVDFFIENRQLDLQELLLCYAHAEGLGVDSASPMDRASTKRILLEKGKLEEQLFSPLKWTNNGSTTIAIRELSISHKAIAKFLAREADIFQVINKDHPVLSEVLESLEKARELFTIKANGNSDSSSVAEKYLKQIDNSIELLKAAKKED